MTATAWEDVARHGGRLHNTTLNTLFKDDVNRFQTLHFCHHDLLIDFSKEKIDAPALTALAALAEAAQVKTAADAMFAGDTINFTENRAVLHCALRQTPATEIKGQSGTDQITATRDRFLGFAEEVRGGSYRTVGGDAFTDVVNIGIGGSDLGPCMAVRALSPDADGPCLHFVSNVDGSHLDDTLRRLDPARTLILIASKTFTTPETMTNADSARDWLVSAIGERAGDHLAAITTHLSAPVAYGIAKDRVFGFWDWVGGRYSIWSAVGLPLALAIGAGRFRDFLAGAAAMDQHFKTAPLPQNLPVLLALIGIWRRNILQYPTVAVIPYDQRLDRFPAYLQQMEMESNGKRITRTGDEAARKTAPVIWGEPGTNAQHSFFQLLHQGTDIIPVDFILARKGRNGLARHHDLLAANCLAQSQALAFGKTAEAVSAEMRAAGPSRAGIEALAPHRACIGDRPSTTLLYNQLDPYTLGRLIALFEHKVFVQGQIWGINSFDQWGVELGKELAKPLAESLAGRAGIPQSLDSSTAGLLRSLRKES